MDKTAKELAESWREEVERRYGRTPSRQIGHLADIVARDLVALFGDMKVRLVLLGDGTFNDCQSRGGKSP